MALGPDGYAWWYVDAVSDDGRTALTLIAMLGSVFSPFYAARRARGPSDPLDHVALNVAIYPLDKRAGHVPARWALTERSRRHLSRGDDHLVLGKSSLVRRDHGLDITIDELSAPLGQRIRGHVRVSTERLFADAYDLDGQDHHRWTPIAPAARVDATFDDPSFRFSGHGYLDANTGDEPLERGFTSWSWSRGASAEQGVADGAVDVAYDARLRRGGRTTLGLRFDRAGVRATQPRALSLGRSKWNLPLVGHTTSTDPRIARSLEDSPFYARTLLRAPNQDENGAPRFVMHEELSLDRFRAPWVQFLLPFRTRREI